jgi:hypothetical protein
MPYSVCILPGEVFELNVLYFYRRKNVAVPLGMGVTPPPGIFVLMATNGNI